MPRRASVAILAVTTSGSKLLFGLTLALRRGSELCRLLSESNLQLADLIRHCRRLRLGELGNYRLRLILCPRLLVCLRAVRRIGEDLHAIVISTSAVNKRHHHAVTEGDVALVEQRLELIRIGDLTGKIRSKQLDECRVHFACNHRRHLTLCWWRRRR